MTTEKRLELIKELATYFTDNADIKDLLRQKYEQETLCLSNYTDAELLEIQYEINEQES